MMDLPAGAFHRSDSADRGRLISARPSDSDYRIGYVTTPLGIVGLYEQGGRTGDDPYTRLDFVADDGRCHSASWRRTFRDRFLVTLANRFAAQVLSGAVA